MANEKEVKEIKSSSVPFNSEQLEIVQRMIQEAKEDNRQSVNSVSMYNQRDPKSIESVNVKRIDGKFVVGWVNQQKDSFKKKPQYLIYKNYQYRDIPLLREPFITLILSSDGIKFEEKEMALVDYMTERDSLKCKVLDVQVKEIVEDFGVLGSNGEYAGAVDERGMPEARPTVLAQVKREERVFTVEVPGFEKPYEFIAEFLG